VREASTVEPKVISLGIVHPAGRKQLPHEIPHWVGDPSFETYFVTICARDRVSCPLVRGETAGRLLESIRFYDEREKWRTGLALVMPDHVHLLTTFSKDLAPVVRAWKRWTAVNLGVAWQRDFFDHRLRGDEKVDETVFYILNNPVRAGLVDEWEKWPHFWMREGIVQSGT
jgi:REP element-mobilizing transposase RayT